MRTNFDLSIKTTGTSECRINGVRSIRRSDNHHTTAFIVLIDSVQDGEKRRDYPFFHFPTTTFFPPRDERVDFVQYHYTWTLLARLFEHIPEFGFRLSMIS